MPVMFKKVVIKNMFNFLFMVMVCIPEWSHALTVDTLTYGSFGKVVIYHPETAPKAVVLFASGDGGWNLGVVAMTKQIVKEGVMVAGFNIRHYFKSLQKQKVGCYYPAGDLETLSMTLQKKYKFKQYMKPILVGYSSGATLVYGALSQAPANTFKGAISLGFCPDIELNKTLCNGSGLSSHVLKENKMYYLEESKKLTAPFIVLQGVADSVCSHKTSLDFVQNCGQFAEMVSLPKVGHGFSVPKNWMPQFTAALNKIVNSPSYAERMNGTPLIRDYNNPEESASENLPLTIIPSAEKDAKSLLFFISGDGGWTGFDQSLCKSVASKGVSVVGLDAQKYFWNSKTPARAAADIGGVIEHYMQLWKVNKFIIAGYSFGADVLPFIISDLPAELSQKIEHSYMISPSENADFEIHISDMLNFGSSSDTYDVIAQLKKMANLKPVCIFGDEEEESTKLNFIRAGAEIMVLPGSHHYNNDFEKLSNVLYKK